MGSATTVAGDNDHILVLVRKALDEFDEKPLDVSIRRAVRIASLLGESKTAVRLAFELTSTGGHPPANREDALRLMTDPETWGDPSGPASLAADEYLADRKLDDHQVMGHSVMELTLWESMFTDLDDEKEVVLNRQRARSVIERARHRTFTALCRWERSLTYGDVNERIFEQFRSSVDGEIGRSAPDLLERFGAVFRRLREAARFGPEQPIGEELAQAVTSCRRILKAVVDHILPGEPDKVSEDGHELNDAKYRNRLHRFMKEHAGERYAEVQGAAFGGLIDRFEALDGLASKGVHADIALEEAELLAINTYIVAGEILRLAARSREA